MTLEHAFVKNRFEKRDNASLHAVLTKSVCVIFFVLLVWTLFYLLDMKRVDIILCEKALRMSAVISPWSESKLLSVL